MKRHFTKEIWKAHKHNGRCSALSVLREASPQWDTLSPSWNWDIERQTSAGKEGEKTKLSSRLLKRKNDAVTWKGSWAVSSR